MKKLFYSLVTLIILNMLLASLNANAQVPFERVVSFPSWYQLYYDSKMPNIYGERSNIDMFFSEWEEWSQLVAKGSAASEYNYIFKKHFSEENLKEERNAKYLSIPFRIEVIKYNCNIHPDSVKVSENTSLMYCLQKSKKPESISYFTPIIESDKKVLYLFPKVEEILSAFLDEPTKTPIDDENNTSSINKEEITDEDWKEVRKRIDMIGKYVPTVVAHWGDGWYFTSYPLIRSIIVGNDGYYIGWSDANYSGQDFFIPWDGDPINLGWWIQ